MGDSLSAAYGITPSRGWVNLLAKHLEKNNYHYQVINASISGETTHGGQRRITELLKQHKPKIVLIALGANDGLRGLSLNSLSKNLNFMILQAKSYHARVLLIGIDLPPNYGEQYTRLFKKVYIDLKIKHNISYMPSLLKGLEDKKNMQADGLHPKEAVQNKIMLLVWSYLNTILK